MKPAAFDYERPATIAEAVTMLGEAGGSAKILAGGQSLGPMLNMRLARPDRLVDVTRIANLHEVSDEGDVVVYGACVTHAAIEDGRVPDATGGMMSAVAAGIAYRAVRNRGTIGGSLAHADPAADWITVLTVVGAELTVAGLDGSRRVSLDEFMESAFETVLSIDEILISVRVPKFSPQARWGFYKVCRKTGEFAEAMSAVVVDPARGVARAVIGATDTRPVVIADATQLISAPETMDAIISENGLAVDGYGARVHRVALWRAIEQLRQP